MMETIYDIVRELRESADLFIIDGRDQGLENPCAVFHEYADRIEAAFKREIAVEFHRNDAAFGALLDGCTKLMAALKAVEDAKKEAKL